MPWYSYLRFLCNSFKAGLLPPENDVEAKLLIFRHENGPTDMNEMGNEEDIGTETVPPAFVYMLYSRGLVKIGFTSDPTVRFDKMRAMSAAPLSLIWLCQGDRNFEDQLHQLFAEDRGKGEWFRPSPAIRKFLRGRSMGGGTPPISRLEWSEANPDRALGP